VSYGVSVPQRLGTTRLRDGRRLGWAEWGPEQGVPVLFFSGAAMGRSLGFGADVVGRIGIRLVGVERPGIGASDPDPDRSLTHWSNDISEFATARELGDFGIVAFSQGAPFALVCATAEVGRAVAIVSGQDDLACPELANQLNPDVANLLAAIESDATAVESRFSESASAAMLWDLITQYSSPVDLAIYTDPEFERAFKESLREGFIQGAAGYAHDTILALSRWPLDVRGVNVPVDLWYGSHDTSTVHSPDHGAVLSRRIPGARRHLIPDAGGSILWTHAEEILDTLHQHLS
jgi:pimeloyl-ACP methyl ester carboxylesterase